MRFDLIAAEHVPVQIHLTAAVLTFALGSTIFLLPKGSRLHKTLGWSFVLTMTVTALSALFIRDLAKLGMPNLWGFSPIHLFVVLTAIALPRGLMAIKRKQVAAHKRAMVSLFIGTMLIAGAFTFLPGRLMNRVLFGG